MCKYPKIVLAISTWVRRPSFCKLKIKLWQLHKFSLYFKCFKLVKPRREIVLITYLLRFSNVGHFLSTNRCKTPLITNNSLRTSRSLNNDDFIRAQGFSTSSQWYGVNYITGFQPTRHSTTNSITRQTIKEKVNSVMATSTLVPTTWQVLSLLLHCDVIFEY